MSAERCSLQSWPSTAPAQPTPPADVKPWPALFALCLGFFMILVDTTIVTVATPAIISDLKADVNSVVWVTSAYLLAYAVPVLITGRLGDRFGPKNLYLVGLTVFTLASLWCGLTTSIEMLIVARVFQGLGASMLTPQTMAVITRIFPADRRGQAMALWGATAGVATLVGPILGGILVDAFGWEWIFFINIPVGVIGFVLAVRLVPSLPTHTHRFDWWGVALSGLGMFFLVFGIQQGHKYHWNGWVMASIIGGIALFVVFVVWQSKNRAEPLVPLSLFDDRNFSISNFAISTMSFTATAMGFPLMLYAQLVRGYSPTSAALLFVPMAVVSIVMAPIVGRFTDKVHPRTLCSLGFAVTAIAVFLISLSSAPTARSGTSSGRWRCSASAWPASGRRWRRPPPATCRCSSRAPARVSTTPPARSVPCSVRPRSPCSSTPGSPPTVCPAAAARGRGAGGGCRRDPRAVQLRDVRRAAAAGGHPGARFPRLPRFRADAAHDAAGHSDPGRCRAGARDDDLRSPIRVT